MPEVIANSPFHRCPSFLARPWPQEARDKRHQTNVWNSGWAAKPHSHWHELECSATPEFQVRSTTFKLDFATQEIQAPRVVVQQTCFHLYTSGVSRWVLIPPGQAGMLLERGSEIVRVYFETWLKALPAQDQNNLKAYIGREPYFSLSSICSGTDSPMEVTHAFAAAVEQVLGETMTLQHDFSCDANPKVRAFLRDVFADSMGHCFSDACELGQAIVFEETKGLVKVSILTRCSVSF